MDRFVIWLGKTLVASFYRFSTAGKAVPKGSPVLLVSNHSNGMADAGVFMQVLERPVRMLIKVSLYESPILGWFMQKARAIPVRRRKDGNTEQNEAAFRAIFDALDEGDLIGLFPEGTSGDGLDLQPLKTGVARMGLGSEARREFQANVLVVPVGIAYSDRDRFMSLAEAQVGEPIELSDYQDDHAKDERAAVRRLTDAIEARLREITPQLPHLVSSHAELNCSAESAGQLLDWAQELRQPGPFKDEGGAVLRLAWSRRLEKLASTEAAQLQSLCSEAKSLSDDAGHLGLKPFDLVGPTKRGGAALLRWLLFLCVGWIGVLVWGALFLPMRRIVRFFPLTPDKFVTSILLTSFLLVPVWFGLWVSLAWRFTGLGRHSCWIVPFALLLTAFSARWAWPLVSRSWRRMKALLLGRLRGNAKSIGALEGQWASLRAQLEGISDRS